MSLGHREKLKPGTTMAYSNHLDSSRISLLTFASFLLHFPKPNLFILISLWKHEYLSNCSLVMQDDSYS